MGPLRAGRARVRLRRVLRGLGPAMSRPKPAEVLRAALGVGAALVLSGALLSALGSWTGTSSRLLLIAPLGATAFLAFVLPNSPLAQPWSAVVGNGLSAFAAIAVLHLGLPPAAAAGAAVCGAIVLMASARALHPPGSALALTVVLGAPAGGVPGFGFILAPVLLDTVLLVTLAVAYNRLTGRTYPFRQPAAAGTHATADPAPERRLGLSVDDLAEMLDRFNLAANIGAEDFGRILAAAEAEAARRHYDDLTCAEVMSRDVVSVTPETRLGLVADLFRRHRFKTLPVVGADGLLCGVITQNDLIQRARRDAVQSGARFATAMTRLADAARGNRLRAGDVMAREVRSVRPGDGIGILLRLLADEGMQAAPVAEEGRLMGIVTRSDLLAVLARRPLFVGAGRDAA